ncbi:MAG: PqqD family protein [Pyrinomonadaceae bacterium]
MNPISKLADIIVQEAGTELLVYNAKTNNAYCLNATSAAIWRECDGTISSAQIALNLSKHFRLDVTTELVELSLIQLSECNLIDYDKSRTDTPDLSRRELIARIGFASAIALPIITSIVAPPAANAASCPAPKVAGGATCKFTCQCPTGLCCRNTIVGRICLNASLVPNAWWGPCLA